MKPRFVHAHCMPTTFTYMYPGTLPYYCFRECDNPPPDLKYKSPKELSSNIRYFICCSCLKWITQEKKQAFKWSFRFKLWRVIHSQQKGRQHQQILNAVFLCHMDAPLGTNWDDAMLFIVPIRIRNMCLQIYKHQSTEICSRNTNSLITIMYNSKRGLCFGYLDRVSLLSSGSFAPHDQVFSSKQWQVFLPLCKMH